MSSKIDRSYVSEVDEFLQNLDADPNNHTPASKNEAAKHAEIAKKRDNAERADDNADIWGGF